MLGDKSVVDVTENDLEDCLLQVQTHGTPVNRNKIKSVFNVPYYSSTLRLSDMLVKMQPSMSQVIYLLSMKPSITGMSQLNLS